MDDTDPLVTVMKVEKAPQETYADIGGLDNQIQEIKVCHARTTSFLQVVGKQLGHITLNTTFICSTEGQISIKSELHTWMTNLLWMHRNLKIKVHSKMKQTAKASHSQKNRQNFKPRWVFKTADAVHLLFGLLTTPTSHQSPVSLLMMIWNQERQANLWIYEEEPTIIFYFTW